MIWPLARGFANGPITWVEDLMVAPERRGAGIGRALMEATEQWAQDQGAAYVALASRRAGAFYLALGYTDSATFYKKTLAVIASIDRGEL